MKKTFTPQEFYDFLRSFDFAFVCRDMKDYNGVFARFDPKSFTLSEGSAVARIGVEIGSGDWEVGGCTFFGKVFQCNFEKETECETMIKVTSDWCKEPYTILLKNLKRTRCMC